MPSDDQLESPRGPDRADLAAADGALEAALGGVRHAISDAFVGFYKDYYGKGPTRCRTYIEQDLVVVVMRDCYTRAEKTLIDAGMWREVREARHAWQNVMADRFRDRIEELTARRVEAFMSAAHHDPDITTEMFTLVRDEG
jgi:uncharacterized protein YbcI